MPLSTLFDCRFLFCLAIKAKMRVKTQNQGWIWDNSFAYQNVFAFWNCITYNRLDKTVVCIFNCGIKVFFHLWVLSSWIFVTNKHPWKPSLLGTISLIGCTSSLWWDRAVIDASTLVQWKCTVIAACYGATLRLWPDRLCESAQACDQWRYQ